MNIKVRPPKKTLVLLGLQAKQFRILNLAIVNVLISS